jgi:hypothetical protein
MSAPCEPMEVAFADRSPIDELDAKLERALRGRKELVLVQAQHVVELQ